MVTHVNIPEFIYQANQMSLLNLPARIIGCKNLPRLLVMKNRLLRCFSVGGIGYGKYQWTVWVENFSKGLPAKEVKTATLKQIKEYKKELKAKR